MNGDDDKRDRVAEAVRELCKAADLPEFSGDRHLWRGDNHRRSLINCVEWYLSACEVMHFLQSGERSKAETRILTRRLAESAKAVGFDWYERRVLFGLFLQKGGTAWRLKVERRPVSNKAMPQWRMKQLKQMDRDILNSAIAGEILHGVENGKTIGNSILDLAIEGTFGIDEKAIETRWHEWRGMKNANALLKTIGTGYKLCFDDKLQCHVATRGRGENYTPLPSASGGRPSRIKQVD